jgi:hypothetical protein
MICKEYFQSDEQNIAPIECHEMENQDFPEEIVEELTYKEVLVCTIVINLEKMKASGIDNINAEFIQATGPQIYRRLHRLVVNIWNQERMPNEGNLALNTPSVQEGRKIRML